MSAVSVWIFALIVSTLWANRSSFSSSLWSSRMMPWGGRSLLLHFRFCFWFLGQCLGPVWHKRHGGPQEHHASHRSSVSLVRSDSVVSLSSIMVRMKVVWQLVILSSSLMSIAHGLVALVRSSWGQAAGRAAVEMAQWCSRRSMALAGRLLGSKSYPIHGQLLSISLRV